jgi:hypothetical protein
MSQSAAPVADTSNPLFIATDLPLLPPGAHSGARPFAVVKAAYEFAARHPEVIGYIPCFCGCERGGRCVLRRRTWRGRHLGITGIDADLHRRRHRDDADANAGASVSQIRQLIEKKYAPHYEGHTPTPPAPTTGRGGTQN